MRAAGALLMSRCVRIGLTAPLTLAVGAGGTGTALLASALPRTNTGRLNPFCDPAQRVLDGVRSTN